jgi:RHS repeat-associated protein
MPTTYSYNTLNRLLQMTNTDPAGLISSYTYTLGAAGNRLQVVEAGPATAGRTVSYTYDAVYRLTQEAINEPGTANDQTITHSYDAVGNRTQMNRAGVVTTYTYDSNDRLLTETSGSTTTTYTYNANGNMLTKSGGSTTDTYTYDAENRLISAGVQSGSNPGSVSYTYDADGMRTSKTTGGVTTTFLLDKNRDHAQVLVETTGSTIVTYGYGHDLISQTRPGTGTRFYQYDGQLSTRQLTSTTGGVTDSYTYDAFGVLLSATGSTPNNYLYTGEQLDPNVGFYYLRARYYNQNTGRFITTDPFQGNIFEPVSLHHYLYANANPLSYIDPSGESIAAAALFSVVFIAFVLYTIVSIETRPNSYDFRARTDEFKIRFCKGATLITGLGGGEITAVIAEKRTDGKAESARYAITITGGGVAIGASSDGPEIPFKTTNKKNVKSFVGLGSVSNVGAGIVVANSTIERHTLPDGTVVDNISLISGGLNTPGKGGKLAKPSVNAFQASTSWVIASTNQSLDRTGTLQCPELGK